MPLTSLSDPLSQPRRAFSVLAARFSDDSEAVVYIIHTSFYITYCGTSWGQQYYRHGTNKKECVISL